MGGRGREERGGGDQSHQIEIILEPGQLAGVWANFAQVSHSEHEFTLDFVRLDYSQGSPPKRGIVVARIAFSPLFVLQLIEALNSNWARYADRAMPREVRGSNVQNPERGDADDDDDPRAEGGEAPSGA